MLQPTSTNNLRQAVRKAMKDRQWNEAELARKCGVPQSTVMRFLNGGDVMYSTGCKLHAAIA